ncbi:sugar transferase [Tropicibacter sp. R15_0]|uniref:sugar transferase n=1 Tax=Tropicibacter sp. R15_0 TaxID=2821101 RepID=UPI001ADBF9DE|nr:sugar transferase [Tropicibacter sp. R15_0]MBO9463848.1 sugar transferase [Tropicibacter sp. R15_0]
MTLANRAFDIFFVLLFLPFLLPAIILVPLAILILDGRPVLYVSERMNSPKQGFNLLKFRTMHFDPDDQGVSGGDKEARITKTGAFLRRYRLDELPQLWNIFKGDIRFVGPRPPLRHYVEKFPEIYGEVLKSRPGVTGLATLAYHKTEERLLSVCETAEETEEVYCRRCVPRKAKLDLIYAQNQTPCTDIHMMCVTMYRKIPIH